MFMGRRSIRVEHTFYQPEIQTMPLEQIREIQLNRLRDKVKVALEKPIPFWKRKLNEGGIYSAKDIHSLEDLTNVPVTVKDEFRESDRMYPPYGDYRGSMREEVIMIGTSSGSTGTPTTTLWTKRDLETEYLASARNMYRGGLRPGMWVVHGHPFGLYGGSTLLTGAYQYAGICPIAVGACESDAELEKVLRYLEQTSPDSYTLFEPAHRRFYNKAVELGLNLDKLNLPDPDSVWPEQAKMAVSGGIDSMGFLGQICHERNGSHVNEDLAITEVLDPVTGKPVPDGERGLLTITTLTKDNFVIRYNVEDIVRILPGYCSCGETLRRMVWDGREKDVVIVKGKRLLPTDLDTALLKYSSEKGSAMIYQIVRINKAVNHDSLRVRVEHAKADTSESASFKAELSAFLSDSLEVPVFVELVPQGSFLQDTFKRTYVIDETDVSIGN